MSVIGPTKLKIMGCELNSIGPLVLMKMNFYKKSHAKWVGQKIVKAAQGCKVLSGLQMRLNFPKSWFTRDS